MTDREGGPGRDASAPQGPPDDVSAPVDPPRADPPRRWSQLPPDPREYDSERNEHARRRGLAAPYIAGGRDPEPEKARQEERRLLRILVLMVIAIVLSGFVLGIVGNLFVAQ